MPFKQWESLIDTTFIGGWPNARCCNPTLSDSIFHCWTDIYFVCVRTRKEIKRTYLFSFSLLETHRWELDIFFSSSFLAAFSIVIDTCFSFGLANSVCV